MAKKSGATLIEELVEMTDTIEGLCEQIRDAGEDYTGAASGDRADRGADLVVLMEELLTAIEDMGPKVKAMQARF